VKLDTATFRTRPWRIHEIAGDLRVEDVWSLPMTGGPGDFAAAVDTFVASLDPTCLSGEAARMLLQARAKLGELLGWDRPETGLDWRVASLAERLPPDLRRLPAPPAPTNLPFRGLYRLDNEWAAEIANHTVHGVIHLGWVADGDVWRAQMAILVKPNGLLGAAYLAAIRTFCHSVIYPSLLRGIDRAWGQHRVAPAAA